MAFPALEGLDFGPALAEFQRDMFLEMIETDGRQLNSIVDRVRRGAGLTVTAGGLGLEILLHNFLKSQSDPNQLIIVINLSPDEQRYHTEMLTLASAFPPPRVTATSTEAFILRLYRHGNRDGFVKAISDAPEALVRGVYHVEKVLKALWLAQLNLWPRFQTELKLALKTAKLDVVECRVRRTGRMKNVQFALRELMESSLQELRRLVPHLDMQNTTVDQVLYDGFSRQIKSQLDPMWHTLSKETKQLVQDIRTLQSLVKRLDSDDAVSFYHYLSVLRTSSHAFNQHSHWLFLDATETLFVNAKARVFEPPPPRGSKVTKETVADRAVPSEPVASFEHTPKWNGLREILEEIAHEAETNSASSVSADRYTRRPAVVCVDDERTRAQLEHFLREGADSVLARQFQRYESWKRSANRMTAHREVIKQQKQPLQRGVGASSGGSNDRAKVEGSAAGPLKGRAKRRRIKQAKEDAAAARQAASATADLPLPSAAAAAAAAVGAAVLGDTNLSSDANGSNDKAAAGALNGIAPGIDPIADFDAAFEEVDPGPAVVFFAVHANDGTRNRLAFRRLLQTLEPQRIVLYEPDLALMRQIEVYAAASSRLPIRVYFMLSESSLEEQRYLTAVKREREAFEKLIHTKKVAAFPADQDGRSGHRQQSDASKYRGTSATGTGVGAHNIDARATKAPATEPMVLVDMREFRSSLPMLIHEFGMELVPLTLTVGDYILSPSLCVERKSVPDLIGSLNSGRLYTQADEMTKYYEKPILLIEFDPTKAFTFLDELSGEIEFKNVISKIALLVLTFPKLRLLWCKSSHATAELFQSLKRQEPEPNPELAVAVGPGGDIIEAEDDGYAPGPKKFLAKLPGITSKNIKRVMDTVTSLHALAGYSLPEMESLLGPADGKKLFDFFRNRGGV